MADEKSDKARRVLIVEESPYDARLFVKASRRVFPDCEIDFTRNYRGAQRKIKKHGTDYCCAFLDHSIPMNRIQEEEVLTLSDKDFDYLWYEGKQESGYCLIDEIRRINPTTLIIGTSSIDGRKLRAFPSPDAKLSKLDSKKIAPQLRKILEEREK